MKKLGFGMMRLPLLATDDETSVDYEKVITLADTFIQNGGTYFDTAAPYHDWKSEEAFRKAVVERYPREAYTVADRLSFWIVEKEEDFQPYFEKQLANLGVDYIDYYVIHALKSDTYALAEKTNAFDFVKKLKADGKIKYIGISFHDSARLLDEILSKHPEIELVYIQINYLDWDDERIQGRQCYEVAVKHNKPVYVMEPVKGGSLVNISDKAKKMLADIRRDITPAQRAVLFAAGHKNVAAVLSGMNTALQMADNMNTVTNMRRFNKDELEKLTKVAETVRMESDIPCAACRYCIKGCPMNIPIADYFGIYNGIRNTTMNSTQLYYITLSSKHGKASDCIECGLCEKSCPQHLPIIKYLKDVAKEFENE